jgi:hypothetical protein
LLRRADDPDAVDPDSHRIVLGPIEQSLPTHNGGMIAFGADDCLYVALGDGGGGFDRLRQSQDTSTPLCAILRLDPDRLPDPAAGNMTGDGVHPHLWSYGLRQPWRFSFDRATGDLYIGDVGQADWEEVNVEPRGQGHRNYGWPIMEGSHCTDRGDGPPDCDSSGLTLPAVDYENSGNAVIGGFVYRGEAIPGLIGRYVHSDYGLTEDYRPRAWTFVWQGENADGESQVCDAYEITDELDLGSIELHFRDRVTSMGQDARGELYLLMLHGTVFRLDPA